MLSGGWLRTGDLGRMNERGFVYLEDRRKDIIVVSGFKVHPSEVEAVAATYPHIVEAVAIASPDERSGEAVALYVVSSNPGTTEGELIDHCRKSLAAYKVPKRVYFRSELPKTIVGKVLRKVLREELSRTRASPTS
jgi:long-chain acyl-CoA synthetase